MWTLESARDDYLKNKKQKHCSNCKFSGLTKLYGELRLCCRVKMEIIEFFLLLMQNCANTILKNKKWEII